MRAEQNALGWMLALSVALHLALVAHFGRRSRVLHRPPDPIPVEVALPHEATTATAAPPVPPVVASRDTTLPSSAAPARRRRSPSVLPVAPVSTSADAGALTRSLQRVAATPELSIEQKRRAMLALLRTWEGRTDPESAERLIDQMLENR